MLRVRSALNYALQCLLTSRNRRVLLLDRASETRKTLLLKQQRPPCAEQIRTLTLTIAFTRAAGLVCPSARVRSGES